MEKKEIIKKITVLGPGEFHPEGEEDFLFLNTDEVELERFSGTVGSFEILYRKDGNLEKAESGAVIIAGTKTRKETKLQDAFLILGDTVPSDLYGKRVGFILDKDEPTDEAVWQYMMSTAPLFVSQGASVDILFRDIEVAFEDGQDMYTLAKKIGVNFIRYEGNVSVNGDTVELEHAIINSPDSKGALSLEYDSVAAPGKAVMPENILNICRQAGVFLDTERFPVKGNLRYELPETNVKGVFYAESDSFEQALEQALSFVESGVYSYEKSGVEIDGAKCAACLTCVRVCPLRAPYIAYDEELQLNRAFIRYEACGGCGICAGECPADAITAAPFEEAV